MSNIFKNTTGRDIVPRPPKLLTAELTPAEVRILRYYQSVGETDKPLPGMRFCRSLRTIAHETRCSTKSVQRANDHFFALGILSWVSGNSASWRGASSRGQASSYILTLTGIKGCEGLGVTPEMLRKVRRQLED